MSNGAFTTYGSTLINGQLVPVLALSGMRPISALAPIYSGRGAVPPTLPSGVTAGPGIGGATSNAQAVQAAAANPFSLQLSPVLWLVIFLAVGLLGLRYVHWRG